MQDKKKNSGKKRKPNATQNVKKIWQKRNDTKYVMKYLAKIFAYYKTLLACNIKTINEFFNIHKRKIGCKAGTA